ncbi:hypothetical protein [Roseisalinus antarcticus]|uniref:Phytase-like domain-containing protein n=1 Tax=Roseisalinus antarcticus TaxID=254357 RepID=A0A1Y5SFH3_9RHOB|nr:hypothetical protein [Roseisalinus antarcticus]SLN39608.1 hypothetical protein ROA7023_01519 [Roseisalinus antarcticus]
MTLQVLKSLTVGSALLLSTALPVAAQVRNIGAVDALIAEASTATAPSELVDGQSGNTDFPFLSGAKPLATVGEVDPETGLVLTGYPDGHAGWLLDAETVRLAYQSESYGQLSSETYPWEMESGATFTGSHIHTIDYDRAGLAAFLDTDGPASELVEGSGLLFSTVYNVFGDEVLPRDQGGVWGNQALPDGTLVDFAPDYRLQGADFFFHSFCGAYYEPANKYGEGVGFADDIWLTAEEWNIQDAFDVTDGEGTLVERVVDTDDTMGLASIVVDIASGTGYTVPALGQTGYEKIMPVNPQNPDYVVLVLAGYNHDLEPAPLKIYVGLKGADVDGTPVAEDAPERDRFLARNGLLHGRIYGMAVANETFAELGIDSIDLQAKMLDAYITNPDAAQSFDVAFVPSSYTWGGWDAPVAVGETEMTLWQDPAEQPEGHTYLVGDSKTEHPAAAPDITRTRWVQNLTQEGGILSVELGAIAAELDAADGALPAMLTGTAGRTLGAYDGALTLNVADAGIKHGGAGTHATWEDGTARAVSPDGLQWIQASDAAVLIVDEDSGNDFGERKYAIVIDPRTLQPTEAGTGYFLAMAGGADNPRAAAGASAYGGTVSAATSSEFSGTWNLTALLARKDDGSFYTMQEIAGTGQQEIIGTVPLNEQTLMGVVQHRSESGGAVAEGRADNGGQIFMFSLQLPEQAYSTARR